MIALSNTSGIRRLKHPIIVPVFFLTLFFLSVNKATLEITTPSILILTAYHQGEDWSDKEIEGVPVRHWTDSQIRCHLFTCVVAMTYLRRIKLKLTSKACGRNELLQALGLSQKSGSFKKALNKLLSERMIERTLSEKPNSRLQKYRITAKGRKVMAAEGDKL